jgi:sugar phosphate isomerase/epimerase
MAFALSTSWNAFQHTCGRELILEIKELGFAEVELSFNLTSLMVEDIIKLAQKKEIKVASIHNYCPIPEGLRREQALPDYYSFASTDEKERLISISGALRSIETASRLNAKAVILHCGRIEIPDQTRKLIALYQGGLKTQEEFKGLRNEMVKERNELKNPFLKNTLRSLEEINSYAKDKGVLLGIENRFYCREIPAFEEIGLILAKFKGSQIRYWHDVGHAQVMQNLGFSRHQEYLRAYGESLLGIHLHDTLGCVDHLAPSRGEFDFSQLKNYLKKDTLKVIEAHHPATGSDLKQSREFLEKIFDERE